MKNQKYLELKKFAIKNGASLFGVADLSKVKTDDFLLEKELLDKFTYAISIGVVLSKGVMADIKDHPTQLYFHHYRQVNSLLDRLALQISRYIENKAYFSLPIAASQLVDWQNQKAHLSHKRIGVIAGLGWLGRNNLLVNRKFGSNIRLVSILTDFPLTTDKPVKDDCGECYECVKVCPAQAIKENQKDFDHIKCLEKLKEFQKKGYTPQYICGVCVKVCY